MRKVLMVLLVTVLALSPVFAAEKTGFTDLKSKIAIGCSVTGSSASVRFWPSDNLGVEASIGLAVSDDEVSIPLSAAMLFPIMEKGNFAINIAPGIGFSYIRSVAGAFTTSGFTFSAGADLMLEMALPIISSDLSIGSGIGAWFTFGSSSTNSVANDGNWSINLVTVSPVMLRYYF